MAVQSGDPREPRVERRLHAAPAHQLSRSGGPPLVYAHRADTPDHEAHAQWRSSLVASPERFALSELVLSGFVRVVTNRKVFADPTPSPLALDVCAALRARSNARVLQPGPRHWLVRSTQARAGLVADAYHAALAIEYGCTWVSTDADFSRFPGLRWEHPLQARQPARQAYRSTAGSSG